MPHVLPPDRRTRWRVVNEDAASGVPLDRRVLAARGLADESAASRFLESSLLHLHEPSLLPGIDTACHRLLDALRRNEPIVIYGDYDVDGITATAILYHMLTHLSPGSPVRCYVPHRLEEGYGLNASALETLAAEGARVVVSVDCGITAVEEARRARELGLDLIITDHHNPRGDGALPAPFALVHPRLPGSGYPFGDLCGAGVAYKLAWHLAVLHSNQPDDRASASARALLLDLLAFAALGSIADMVPLQDENRVLTRYGLGRIRGSRFEGLRALVQASGLDSARIDADDVGFRLAPRLNACGRMGHAAHAVRLFTEAAGDEAAEIAERLHEQNLQRQATERRITEQACELAEAQGLTGDDRRAIVLSHPEWHPGVVGIVCSRLVERYARPVILLCDDGETAKGSGRSIAGFNLHGALEATSGRLLRFGGHDAAAGLAVRSADLRAFADEFIEHVGRALAPEDLVNEIRVDCVARLDELTPEAVRSLDQLRPFGRGNPKVRVLVRDAVIDGAEVFGAAGRHLALRLRDRTGDRGAPLRCLLWNQGVLRDACSRGSAVDAVLTPMVSSFSGRVEPTLEDWRPAAGEHYSSASTGKVARPSVG